MENMNVIYLVIHDLENLENRYNCVAESVDCEKREQAAQILESIDEQDRQIVLDTKEAEEAKTFAQRVSRIRSKLISMDAA